MKKLKFETLKGFTLNAQDDEIGKIKDVLFDDHQWGGRWLVADTHRWLPGRKVLLSPISFEDPDVDSKTIPVRMSKQAIQESPPLDEDAPVSLQYEKSFYDQFYWPYYWIGGGLWANHTHPVYLNRNESPNELNPDPDPEHQDHVLRSANELTTYQVTWSQDLESETLGTVEDLVIDTGTWAVPYLIVRNRKLLSPKRILVPREFVVCTQWKEHSIQVDFDADTFEAAPELEDGDGISQKMEEQAHSFFHDR